MKIKIELVRIKSKWNLLIGNEEHKLKGYGLTRKQVLEDINNYMKG